MAFTTLSKLKKNSPYATLTAAIESTDTEIPIDHLEYFHDEDGTPLLEGIVLGFNDDIQTRPEEITITAPSTDTGAGSLLGATRGVNADGTIGVATSWDAGTLVAVMYSYGVHNQIKDNLDALDAPIHQILWQPQQMTFDVPPSMGGTGAEVTYEKLSNGIVQGYMAFSTATAQYVFCEGVFPVDWDEAAVDITGYMRVLSTSADTDDINFKVYGRRYTSTDSRDMDLSTEILATFAFVNGGANYTNVSTGHTLTDMQGSGRNFVMMITRDYSTESTSQTGNAGVLSFEIYPTRNLA